jgi:hypothetical protein
VLSAARDPRADAVLESTMAELMAQADRIADGPARQGFLQRVPHHREILAAWENRRG